MGWVRDRYGKWVWWDEGGGERADRDTERWAGEGGGGGGAPKGGVRTRERDAVEGGGGPGGPSGPGGPGGGYGPGGGGGAGMPDWWTGAQGPRQEGESAQGYYVRRMMDPVSGFGAIHAGIRPDQGPAPEWGGYQAWEPGAEGAPTYAEGDARMRALMGAPEYQTAIPDQWRVRQMAQPQIEAQAAQTGRLLRELGRDQGFGPGGGGAALRQQALAQVGGGAAGAMATAQEQLFGAEQARTQAGLGAAQAFAAESWGTEYAGAQSRFQQRQEQRFGEWSTEFGAWHEAELQGREQARLMWDTWARLQTEWKIHSTPPAY